LPPQKGFAYNATPLLCTFNPFIVPRPVDWPEQIRLTGHWVLETPQHYTPPLRVLEFMRWNEEEGMGTPIYFGYGKVPLFSTKVRTRKPEEKRKRQKRQRKQENESKEKENAKDNTKKKRNRKN